MNKNLTIECNYEIWVMDKEELNENPIIWLLNLLILFTNNNIQYKIIKNKYHNPYNIILKGKYLNIEKIFIDINYIDKFKFEEIINYKIIK